MGVISSASVAVETLKRNPILFVVGFAVALANGVVAGGQMLSTGIDQLGWSLGSYAVQLGSLFFVAGAYGMVAEAIDGTTRLKTLLSEGKDNFADVLAATLLLVIAMVAAFVFVGFLAFIVGIGVLWSGSAGGLPSQLFVLAMVGVYLIALLPMFFLQFYIPAVVVSDQTPADALKQSYRMVRSNFFPTLGFDAVVVAMMLVGSLPTIWLFKAKMYPTMMGATAPMASPITSLSPATILAYVAITVALGTLTGTFFYAYQVVFYENCLLVDTDEAVQTTGD